MKIAVCGGIKSGKSSFAEQKALELSNGKRAYYLATSEPFDVEMKEKIKKHKTQRGKFFETIEEPIRIHERAKRVGGVILLECVSMWLNNMLYNQKSDEEIFGEIEEMLLLPQTVIFVINSTSEGIISENPLIRRFVELNGTISQKIAKVCNEVYYLQCGIPLKIKG